MIPAPKGLKAQFEKNGLMDVLAFDDDGHAMVLGHQSGRLIVAASMPGFKGILWHDPSNEIVSLIPAEKGWWVRETEEDGKTYDDRVIAWGITTNGVVMALEKDGSGLSTVQDMGRTEVFFKDGAND